MNQRILSGTETQGIDLMWTDQPNHAEKVLQQIRVLLLTMYLPTLAPNIFSIIMLILRQQDMV